MVWVDGKEHRLTWSFRWMPMKAVGAVMDTVNDRPFLGVDKGRLQLQRADYEIQQHGGWTVTFTFMECPPNELANPLVVDDGKATPVRLYEEVDFRKMFVEPRVGLWRRLVNWFKGG